MCPHSVPLPRIRGELRDPERRSEGSIDDRLWDGGGETFGTTEGNEIGVTAGGLSETKVENERPRAGTIPEAIRVIPGRKSESRSGGEIPIEAESPLVVDMTVRFLG